MAVDKSFLSILVCDILPTALYGCAKAILYVILSTCEHDTITGATPRRKPSK